MVVSQQSGTLQRIILNPDTFIAAPSTGCSLTQPCRFEIMVTSEPRDFPLEKPVGGFPAGAFMSGKFTGTGNGDTISATAESSGLTSAVQLTSTDVINLTPATGGANTGTTLPHTCSGSLACKFTSGAFKRNFWSDLAETVQHECGTNADGMPIPSCLTRLKTKITVELKTNNNRVILPFTQEKHNISAAEETAFTETGVIPQKIPTKELIKTAIVPVGDLDIGHLLIGSNNFALTAKMMLGEGGAIDPSAEETYFSIGPFSLLVLKGKFKKLLQGKLYTFLGKVDGLDVAATFVRDLRDPKVWGVVLGVHGVQLPRPQPSDPQVAVRIGVGSDSGTDLVTPKAIR